MNIGWRMLMGLAIAYPVVHSVALLGMALPIDHIDAVLTAWLFGLLAVGFIVSWVLGAHKVLTMIAAIFLPGSLLAAVFLILPR